MKNARVIIILSSLAIMATSEAQQPPPENVGRLFAAPKPVEAPPPEKTFSLNFPGGPVGEFAETVQTATGDPFNVIIPESAADLRIPPVRVRAVTLTPLLGALSASSLERKAVVVQSTGTGGKAWQGTEYQESSFKFTPTIGSSGSIVWQLNVNKITPPPEVPRGAPPIARFYQLKPNLDAGLKIEDITTVAQAAWTMMKLEGKEIPELKVHEETGILIAVGSVEALGVIDSMLRELPKKQPAPAPAIEPLPRAQ